MPDMLCETENIEDENITFCDRLKMFYRGLVSVFYRLYIHMQPSITGCLRERFNLHASVIHC